MMKDYSKQRHVVRHGSLTPGCSFWAPISLSVGSYKNLEPLSDHATLERKLPQTSMQYQSTPKHNENCGGCTRFEAGIHSCQRIDGYVCENGWCLLWSKKA